MSETTLAGHCYCGAVRYRCAAPLYPATLCHCESCRRVAAAHAVAWLTVPAISLVYTRGKPVEFQSSARAYRSFCRDCGTPLTYRSAEHPAEIDITLVTLNNAASFAPLDHTWMADALAWDRPGDGLPQLPETRAPRS